MSITKCFNARLAIDYWIIVWGKGQIEMAVALSESEAIRIAASGKGFPVEPLVSFR